MIAAAAPDASAGPVVIGLDGGGSKTLLAVARPDGTAAACFREAGSNPFDAPDWRGVLQRLKARAVDFLPSTEAAVFGLPGYGEVSAVSAAQEAAAQEFGAFPLRVLNDVHAAYEGAFVGQPGVLLLAGTGSMAWAASAAGENVRVGGWGDAFGDEGSAYWIGRETIARVSRMIDGRLPPSGLAEALFTHLGLSRDDRQEALIDWYGSRTHPRSDLARLAQFVDGAAETGDAQALRILDDAAEHLAAHVLAAWKAIVEPGADESEIRWSFAGGAFRSRILLDRVTAKIGTRPTDPALPPIGGALWRAARDAGWTVNETWLSRLGKSLAGFPEV
ncbi:BadF-type ATPase [Faunimonas pinastri]|uniref:BadF-type ATPase n=1 Tax=Faunimonas pinastri TaxID=1855383 RepID=A0A1H9IGH2_9HYPH|nr:BadF/BadG/BcrA/BcrD ATPase family protein [Faunimonas pinastri]SEQ73693.1 BadF-type ATPase [Faunimonas pinastri]